MIFNYAQIREYDIANGPGIRSSIFLTGCVIKCENCFNPEYQDENYGNPVTEEVLDRLIKYIQMPSNAGLTVLGGEPFYHADMLDNMLKYIKDRILPYKTIWVYSGYLFENLIKDLGKDIFNNIDVLVDGSFIQKKKDLSLKFRGSSNQRIIDVKESLLKNKIIELTKYYN